MDMERQENTIYHLEKLHKAQEGLLYGVITAGDVICQGACMKALPPQAGMCRLQARL